MFKRLAIVALLSVFIVGAKTNIKSSAKTYTINISESAKAGAVDLKPGEYKLKLDGPQVVMTDKDGNEINAGAKLETGDRKFEQTAVSTTNVDGTNRILYIQIGGSRNTVVFE